MPSVTTLGRELLRRQLPEGYKETADVEWTSENAGNILTRMAKNHPDEYHRTLNHLNHLGRYVVADYGKDASITLDDFKVGPAVKHLKQSLQKASREITHNKSLTPEQKNDRIRQLAIRYYNKAMDIVRKDADEHSTSFASQLKANIRGKPIQMMQLLFGNMVMQDSEGRIIPFMGLDSYAAGVNPLGMWTGALAGRRGNVMVQFATADAGYLSKQSNHVIQDNVVSMHDCGTTSTGITADADDQENLGAVLLKPYGKYPAGYIVDEKFLKDAKEDDEIIVRSPHTCLAGTGTCALCSGLNEKGKLPDIGEYMSFNSTKAWTEPLTQSAVGSKHAAAANLGSEDDDTVEDSINGLPAVAQMLLSPTTFKGKAVLADHDGKVTDVRKAPQGGWFVSINNNKPVYVPQNRRVKVEVGDMVEAGDKISNGIPRPSELMEYKGIGAGRTYFTKQFAKETKEAGAGTTRRNIEQFTRSMINRVEITDPDGFKGYLPGDVVDYNTLQSRWEPREDSISTTPDRAIGKILDKPVLDYNIGVKITKPIADRLKKFSFNDIVVNDKEPPFKPVFVNSKSMLGTSKDWMAGLMGERIQQTLFTNAQVGSEAKIKSPSMYTNVVMEPYKTDIN